MIIPENYVLGKILLGWSSAFYRSWLRSARSLMTVRYGGAPPFRGDRGGGEGRGPSGSRGRMHPRISTRGPVLGMKKLAQNSSDYARRAPFVPINPDDARTTPRDYSLIVEIAPRACERKDLISRGTKYLGIYDHDVAIYYTSTEIFNSRQFLTRIAVANLRARGYYTRRLDIVQPVRSLRSAFIANAILKIPH